jgi:hypothetical protein
VIRHCRHLLPRHTVVDCSLTCWMVGMRAMTPPYINHMYKGRFTVGRDATPTSTETAHGVANTHGTPCCCVAIVAKHMASEEGDLLAGAVCRRGIQR